MNNDRNWTVLFIGGASGIGKSSLAYEIAKLYGINVLEVDDIYLTLKSATSKENFPAIHYWDSGINWKDVGIEGNVDWLIDVSKEMMTALKNIANRHIEDKLPVIIEGDFIHPELLSYFDDLGVKFLFMQETEKNRIIKNYLSREGGKPQNYRAEISVAYGYWIADKCKEKGIGLIKTMPRETLLDRVLECLR